MISKVMLKIKEYWGKILIYIFGIPPSIIAEQCSDELRKELKLTKKRFKHTEIVQDGKLLFMGLKILKNDMCIMLLVMVYTMYLKNN